MNKKVYKDIGNIYSYILYDLTFNDSEVFDRLITVENILYNLQYEILYRREVEDFVEDIIEGIDQSILEII